MQVHFQGIVPDKQQKNGIYDVALVDQHSRFTVQPRTIPVCLESCALALSREPPLHLLLLPTLLQEQKGRVYNVCCIYATDIHECTPQGGPVLTSDVGAYQLQARPPAGRTRSPAEQGETSWELPAHNAFWSGCARAVLCRFREFQ